MGTDKEGKGDKKTSKVNKEKLKQSKKRVKKAIDNNEIVEK